MKSLITKHHDAETSRLSELKIEEIEQVAGGERERCPDGSDITVRPGEEGHFDC